MCAWQTAPVRGLAVVYVFSSARLSPTMSAAPLFLSLSLSTRLLALRPARRCSLSAIWTSVCLSVRPSVCLRAACRRRRLELQRRHSAATTLKLCCDIAVIRDCHCRWPLSRPSPTANQLPEVVFKLVLVAARHVTVE